VDLLGKRDFRFPQTNQRCTTPAELQKRLLQCDFGKHKNFRFLSGGYVTSWWGVFVPAYSREAPSPPTDAVAGAGGEWRQMDWFRFLMSSLSDMARSADTQ
jgi:hypothetical protein